jgi:hypothetical protein
VLDKIGESQAPIRANCLIKGIQRTGEIKNPPPGQIKFTSLDFNFRFSPHLFKTRSSLSSTAGSLSHCAQKALLLSTLTNTSSLVNYPDRQDENPHEDHGHHLRPGIRPRARHALVRVSLTFQVHPNY